MGTLQTAFAAHITSHLTERTGYIYQNPNPRELVCDRTKESLLLCISCYSKLQLNKIYY